MVKAEYSRSRGRGFESRRRILDGKLIHCNKETEKIKVAECGQPPKIILRKENEEKKQKIDVQANRQKRKVQTKTNKTLRYDMSYE